MGTYKYSRLKQDKIPVAKPDHLARQTGHAYYSLAEHGNLQDSTH